MQTASKAQQDCLICPFSRGGQHRLGAGWHFQCYCSPSLFHQGLLSPAELTLGGKSSTEWFTHNIAARWAEAKAGVSHDGRGTVSSSLPSDCLALWIFTHDSQSWCLSLPLEYVPLCGLLGGASGREPACQCWRLKRCRFNPWVRKIPWRRKGQPTPVFLPGESHGQRSLAGYSPRGHEESDTTETTSCTAHVPLWPVCLGMDLGLWN